MNLIELQEKFNTHAKCIKHLEKVRWEGVPYCPHCLNEKITSRALKKKSPRGRKRINPVQVRKTPLMHCNTCNKDFTVLDGTIFEGSKMPLQKWVMLISLMLDARKGISAANIHRNIGVTYKTAWYSAMRVRCSMLDQADMLEGIVEMDEMYVGGKPRHRYKQGKGSDSIANLSKVTENEWRKKKGNENKKFDKRALNKGRGTDNKIKVVGIVERGGKGRVAMKIQDSLTGQDLLKMLKRYVNTKEAIVMTDDFRSYKAFDKVIQHYTVNHSQKEYVKYLEGIEDSIHTNTIEGVWSIIKNGIRGQYHVLSKKYLPFYLAEAAYKYNRRDKEGKKEAFDETINNAVNDQKCEVNYKPKAYPKFLAYRRKKKKTGKRKKPDNL